ncbi:hypothetical protein HOE67_02870 [Candidatus Peregrinibacteria bacterium]|nr:hypothetical protein [Candidatus Peregrinibacteria bacterium]MBT4056029.1 hypothetical protein [Candidatus Peregrinibacteria bacterium]
MILITIDNNKDFMRVRMNKSRFSSAKKKRGFFSKFFTSSSSRRNRKPLIPSVF